MLTKRSWLKLITAKMNADGTNGRKVNTSEEQLLFSSLAGFFKDPTHEILAVHRAWTVFDQGPLMLGGTVAYVSREAVLGIARASLGHNSVAIDLGQD